MMQEDKTHILDVFLGAIVDKISRRTSEEHAFSTVDTILKKLVRKHPFLKHVTIQNPKHSEHSDVVSVNPEINHVETRSLREAMKEIALMTVEHMNKNMDFFFIRELKDALGKTGGSFPEELNALLASIQKKSLQNKIEKVKIKNLEVVKSTFEGVFNVLLRKMSDVEAIKLLSNIKRKLEAKHEFFKHIKIQDEPDNEGFYYIFTSDEINNVHSVDIGRALQDLIVEAGKSNKWGNKKEYVERLEKEFEKELITELRKRAVNFGNIINLIDEKKHCEVTKKVVETLIYLASQKKPQNVAISTVDNTIKNLKNMHSILEYIQINKPRVDNDKSEIRVDPKINNVEPYKIGKAIRDLIKNTSRALDEENTEFIQNFKEQIGSKYLNEMEKLGVNIHFLELRYGTMLS